MKSASHSTYEASLKQLGDCGAESRAESASMGNVLEPEGMDLGRTISPTPDEQFHVYTSESDDIVEECFTNEEPEVDYDESMFNDRVDLLVGHLHIGIFAMVSENSLDYYPFSSDIEAIMFMLVHSPRPLVHLLYFDITLSAK